MAKIPLTAPGAQRLREELQRLKSVERPRIINAIDAARAHGDLKENDEYHPAKAQQGFIEGRIAEIEAILSNAQIIDVASLNAIGKVVFGATVDLIEEKTGDQVSYQIVGDLETNIKQGHISVSTPNTRTHIGKE